MVQRAFLSVLLGALCVGGCASKGPAIADPNSSAFVTMLGEDTVAVEQFTRNETQVRARVVLRSPRTTYHEYVLEVDRFDNLVRYESTIRTPEADADLPPLRHEVVVPEGDSLRQTVTQRGSSETMMLPVPHEALPFIDMVHWPFDVALRRAHRQAEDSLVQPMFSGRNGMAFIIQRHAEDRMSIQHPFRGTMQVEVDSLGGLAHLDARSTTRKLIVRRVPSVDLDQLLRSFAARDVEGASFGDLSGRGETVASIQGATITVDYGQPARRGRDIFGALVPYGEVWRTGANLATHFSTDRTLLFDGVRVPPGRYTLFSIPEEDGGTLIINQQTGQGGTSYDPTRDLGRVNLQRTRLEESIELFTIAVEPDADGGRLMLQWDRSAYAAPFRVEEE